MDDLDDGGPWLDSSTRGTRQGGNPWRLRRPQGTRVPNVCCGPQAGGDGVDAKILVWFSWRDVVIALESGQISARRDWVAVEDAKLLQPGPEEKGPL